MKKNVIQDQTFDEERALYGVRDTHIQSCVFEGPADGESALKEAGDILVTDTRFCLRYPLWHVHGATLQGCAMTETCRAALWYDRDLALESCKLHGIKALRECDRITLSGCDIRSAEFGWLCRDLSLSDCTLEAEYAFLQTQNLQIDRLRMTGKYSFQYVRSCNIRDSVLDTKDAFWHAKNVTVTDSVVKGEYLGWYSEGLTLIRCRIVGTQPLCYARDLTLIDCEMQGCDLSFENSTVNATVRGRIDSVKSPAGGHIVADEIGEIIHDRAPVDGTACEIRAERSPLAK